MTDWSALGESLLERHVLLHRSGSSSEAADGAVDEAQGNFDAVLTDESPFGALATHAGLDRTEAMVLSLVAAVDLDRRLQSLLAVLGRSLLPHRVDVELVLELIGPEAVSALGTDGRLARAGLVEVEPGVPLAAARLHIHRRVVWALLGDVALDPALAPQSEYVVPDHHYVGEAHRVLVHGADPVRRVEYAAALTLGLAFVRAPVPSGDDGWLDLVRQATVVGAGLLLDVDGPLTGRDRHWIERADHLPMALLSATPLPLETLPDVGFAEVAAADPQATPDEWSTVFPGAPVPARWPTADQLRLAEMISGGGLTAAEAVRRVTSGTLLAHATRVVPRATRDDLILPDLQARQLQALLDRYRQRSKVHEEWGLSLYPSPGVVALFSGPSGTGKTTSAEVLAHELGVEMFRVDLSALVSKYIGETEKNLEQIFSAAHTGNYLLLFDEADSLFGSRSKVTDSKDRYANLEVSYLLQRLETYDGFVVLTSNFQGNIDPAFLRRIHATVHFALPTGPDRVRIWERSLGKAPVAEVDLTFVAEQFDLSGGSIRNAALSAAFAAAAADRAIEMPDLLRAVAAEMTKLGRRPNDAQFGRWLGAVTHP